MDILTIILEQIGLFVIYIIVGVLLVRTKVFNATTLEPLSRFVLKLGLPVMIFINTVSGVDRAGEDGRVFGSFLSGDQSASH